MSCPADPATRVASRRPLRTVPRCCSAPGTAVAPASIGSTSRATRNPSHCSPPATRSSPGCRWPDRSGGGLRGRGPHRLWRDRRGGPHLRHPHHADQPHRHLDPGRCAGRSRGPQLHHRRRLDRARLRVPADGHPDRTDASPAGHPRRPAQRLEPGARPRARLPATAGSCRVDGADPQSASERRLRRGVLRRQRGQVGTWRPGGLPRPAARTHRGRHRRPGPDRRHRLLLRRVHDVLAHRALRPVRRRDRGRRGCRHRQPGRIRRGLPRPVTRTGRHPLGRPRTVGRAVSVRVRRQGHRANPGAARRCRRPLPTTQAEQWFAALRARGVPTEMVLYPGASHLFILNGRPAHRRDYSERIVDWLERHAGGKD